MTKYVSLDIETTGLDPEHHNIIEFGAVLDDLREQAPIEELPQFHCYVLPPDKHGYQGDPYALQMNHEILLRIATRRRSGDDGGSFLYPGQVASAFEQWCTYHGLVTEQHAGPNMTQRVKFVPAGKNAAGFDLPFLRKQIPGFDQFRISHRVLDPAMLYFDPAQDDVPPDLATCLQRAGLSSEVPHLAVEDAKLVIQLIRARFPLVGGTPTWRAIDV